MKLKFLGCVLAGVVAQAAHADFVNGSFETGQLFTGWTTHGIGTGLLFIAPYPTANFLSPPGGGKYFAFIASEDLDPDTLSQTLNTVAGDKYTLSFWAGEDYGTGPFDNLEVTWDGSVLYNSFVPGVQTPDGLYYYMQPFSFTVTGTGSDTVEFSAWDDANFIAIDNAHLTYDAVPEPAPLVVFGLGALCLSRRRRS